MNPTVYVSFWDCKSCESEVHNQTEWRKGRITAGIFQHMKATKLKSP